MENSDTDNNTGLDDAMYLELGNRTDNFEFVDVASEVENDNHTGITQIIEENWDLDSNPIDVAPGVEHFPANDEHEYPNVAQLSVEPVSDENNGVYTLVAEECSIPEDKLSGMLRFTVKIDNLAAFSSQQRKVISDEFYCRDFPFRLIVHNRAHGLSLSAFVCRAKSKNQLYDSGLEILAICQLSFVDQLDTTLKMKKTFTNSFRTGADWGFTDLLDEQQADFCPGIVQNNSLIIHVQIKAEPPFCYNNYSKAITGCVGIRNQGATCYMNSLLQVLYFINKFRTACYRIPTEMDDKKSMALAIQKVFYNLEYSESSVCTTSLTNSFGWSTVDVLTQHDIQEMMRVLIDKIESRMKNTLLEPLLPSMFAGKFVSYVKCRDIEFSSQREEVFYDIQLSLENSNNVYESFKRYVSPELMDDENKYHAGTYGLQAAEKGTLFMSLPPVMFLHLLRFQFDAVANQVMKNNNFFEFEEHINLTEFVREEDSTTWNYTLFAVLSHSGGGSHGHYVAYINPSLKGQWLKFDDETISLVSAYDAIDSNFGSSPDADEWTKSVQLNAYMLVYVRDTMVNEIFEPTDPKYITDELKKAAASEIDDQRNYNHLKKCPITTEIFVLLCTILESDLSFGIKKFANVPRFKVTRNLSTADFKKVLQEAFKISGNDQIRVWRVIQTTTSYSYPVYLNEEDPFVQTLLDHRDISRMYAPTAIVWAEIASPGSVLPAFDRSNDVLVFYNYYCAKECRLMYIQHGYHDKSSSLAELIPILNQLMEWQNRELNIYQVFRETKVGKLNAASNFSEYAEHEHDTFLMNIVFEPTDHDTSTKLNSIALYYNDILLRVGFTICNIDHPKDEENFEMSLEASFPEFMDVLARRLNCDRNKIQIFNTYGSALGTPVPSTCTEILKSIFNSTYQRIHLFYKVHTVDVIDVETKHNFTFHWLSIDMKKQDQFTLYLSDDETIESILTAAKQIIDSDRTHGSGVFRILSVVDDRLSLVTDVKEIYDYTDKTKSDGIPLLKRRNYRIEEIPKNDEILNENEHYCSVAHYRPHTTYSSPTTHPFLFKVDITETWQRVKDRLRSRLNISETNWSDYSAQLLIPDNWELEISDSKCLNELIQSPEFFSICLNKRKPKHGSDKVTVASDPFLSMFNCS